MREACRFGTDGVRGKVGHEPMVPDTLVRLGYAIGKVLGGSGQHVIVGKDTRLSGYMVESAVEAGLAAAGIEIALTGPLPTSAIALLVAAENASAGIVISASHNPHEDNGIKIFDANGNKLSDSQEAEIERLAAPDGPEPEWVSEPGKARRIDDAAERYVEFCLGRVPGLDLGGMLVVVDAANGAAYATAPEVLRRAGANIYEIGCSPDGLNINLDCGALHPETAGDFLRAHNFDVAVTLDGDADRLVMIDATGRVVDGDAYLFAVSSCLERLGEKPEGMVGTQMSNCALEASLGERGIEFHRAPVGDRNVLLALAERGWKHGSEPSGHILLPDLHVTGDGLLAALYLLKLLAQADMDLAAAVAGYRRMPSESRSLATDDAPGLLERLEPVAMSLRKDERVGRIVLRPSGTEPIVRLLVEASDREVAAQVADEVAAARQGI